MIDYDISPLDRFIKGIEIIRKHVGDAYDLAAEHDVVFFGAYETREQMTQQERDLMDSYGWHNEYESWAFFV